MKTKTTQSGRLKTACLLLVLVALVMPSAGCSLLAVVGIVGDAVDTPSVPAQYIPPKTSPMLVLVENRKNPGMVWPESEQLATFISADLTAHNICPVIPQSKLADLRDKDPLAMRRMSITAIGKAVDAKQVLYVDVESVDNPAVTGAPVAGRLEMRVHVVDVATGKTAWPVAPNEPTSLSFEAQAPLNLEPDRMMVFSEAVFRGAGHDVARLFYEYDPTEDTQK
jgi:hypothetical protein